MMENLYDWLGIADLILKNAGNKKHLIVADVLCGTGRRIKRLKTLLSKHGLDITIVGVVPKNATYGAVAKKNLDIMINPEVKIGADFVISIDTLMPRIGINAKILLKKGGMLISSNPSSTYMPKTLGRKSRFIDLARKCHKIEREIDGNSLDEVKINDAYERIGIYDEIIKHAKAINRNDIIIIDAGCGSGNSLTTLKKKLETVDIKAYVIGIDNQHAHSKHLDVFINGKVESLGVMPTADIVLSIGSGPILLSKRIMFINKCFNMLRSDGLYIENVKPTYGLFKAVKKSDMKSYMKLVKTANDSEVQYHEEYKNLQIETLLSLNPETSHPYSKKLEKFGTTPHKFALTWLLYNQPKSWKSSEHGGLSLYNLFSKYIDDGQVVLYDDLFEVL